MTAECKTKRNKSACVDSFDIIGMYDNQCQVIERKKAREGKKRPKKKSTTFVVKTHRKRT